MIRTQGLSKSFGGVTAVNAVDLRVETGEIFGLVGPDGAGKTTLMRMILGIVEPSAGSLSVMGNAQIESVKKSIGYIPQILPRAIAYEPNAHCLTTFIA